MTAILSSVFSGELKVHKHTQRDIKNQQLSPFNSETTTKTGFCRNSFSFPGINSFLPTPTRLSCFVLNRQRTVKIGRSLWRNCFSCTERTLFPCSCAWNTPFPLAKHPNARSERLKRFDGRSRTFSFLSEQGWSQLL